MESNKAVALFNRLRVGIGRFSRLDGSGTGTAGVPAWVAGTEIDPGAGRGGRGPPCGAGIVSQPFVAMLLAFSVPPAAAVACGAGFGYNRCFDDQAACRRDADAQGLRLPILIERDRSTVSTAVPPAAPPLDPQPLDIEDELKESYLNYAMSVIISRALPDVRDGLKPSQRRILVAMRDLGLSPGASTSKCAGIVGETMKRYHPHGDNSIYPTLARMAQWWNMRHLLITGQGELRQHPRAAPGGDAVYRGQAQPGRRRDARGHPARHRRLPAQLRREIHPGAAGPCPASSPTCWSTAPAASRWSMATSIPPHNLGEDLRRPGSLTSTTRRVIELDELMEIIPGPDFPTGATICNKYGLREAYRTGRGRVILRAKYDIEELKDGRAHIAFTEIPYQPAPRKSCSSKPSPSWSTAGGSPAWPTSTTSATAISRCGSW